MDVSSADKPTLRTPDYSMFDVGTKPKVKNTAAHTTSKKDEGDSSYDERFKLLNERLQSVNRCLKEKPAKKTDKDSHNKSKQQVKEGKNWIEKKKVQIMKKFKMLPKNNNTVEIIELHETAKKPVVALTETLVETESMRKEGEKVQDFHLNELPSINEKAKSLPLEFEDAEPIQKEEEKIQDFNIKELPVINEKGKSLPLKFDNSESIQKWDSSDDDSFKSLNERQQKVNRCLKEKPAKKTDKDFQNKSKQQVEEGKNCIEKKNAQIIKMFQIVPKNDNNVELFQLNETAKKPVVALTQMLVDTESIQKNENIASTKKEMSFSSPTGAALCFKEKDASCELMKEKNLTARLLNRLGFERKKRIDAEKEVQSAIKQLNFYKQKLIDTENELEANEKQRIIDEQVRNDKYRRLKEKAKAMLNKKNSVIESLKTQLDVERKMREVAERQTLEEQRWHETHHAPDIVPLAFEAIDKLVGNKTKVEKNHFIL